MVYTIWETYCLHFAAVREHTEMNGLFDGYSYLQIEQKTVLSFLGSNLCMAFPSPGRAGLNVVRCCMGAIADPRLICRTFKDRFFYFRSVRTIAHMFNLSHRLAGHAGVA